MREPELRQVFARLGIQITSVARTGWLNAHCPLAPWTHRSGRDTRPSFAAVINTEGPSRYTCLTCHAKGKVTTLVRELARLREHDHTEISQMAEMAEVQVDSLPPIGGHREAEADLLIYDPNVAASLEGLYPRVQDHGAGLSYVQGRGIGEATCRDLDLMFDAEQGRVLFPVRDFDGLLYGFTGRAIADDIQPKVRDYAGLKKRHLILGEDRWTRGKHRRTLIVEGLFALAHLIEIGAEQEFNVGAVMGSMLYPAQAQRIIRVGGPVYILFDNDDAGDAGTFGPVLIAGDRDEKRGAWNQLCKQGPTFIPPWPAHKTDPDELTIDEVIAMLDPQLYLDEVVI